MNTNNNHDHHHQPAWRLFILALYRTLKFTTMKTTILVKMQKRLFRDSNFFPHAYIIDVEGELNADVIKEAIKGCVGSASGWYLEDIKILATNP